MGKRILFVHGIPRDTRARELAREFERYGPIVRCDVPPSRDGRSAYAFVQYEDNRDANDAYRRLHGKPFNGGTIRIEWAKKGPEAREYGGRDRRGRSRSPVRGRSRSPVLVAVEDRRRDRSHSRSASRSRSRSPYRSATGSPVLAASNSHSPVRSASPARSCSPTYNN